MARGEFAPVTPGEMLKEEFLAEYRLSQNQLARAIGTSPNRIAEIAWARGMEDGARAWSLFQRYRE
jgi:plasmid maintenance system antidote protein VapI